MDRKPRTKNIVSDVPGPGEGRLILKLNDDNFIQVGETRIYLNYINGTGADGGKREVSLQFVGPKSVPIDRGIKEFDDDAGNR